MRQENYGLSSLSENKDLLHPVHLTNSEHIGVEEYPLLILSAVLSQAFSFLVAAATFVILDVPLL